MKYKKLYECASFSKKRTSHITFENYISTENMIPNRGGIDVPSSLPNVKTTSYYEEKDILISNIRPYFKKIWFASHDGACSNDVLVIKSNEEYLPQFIYYVLSDDNFFNYATVTAKGTKMPRGTTKAIMKYLVPDVSIEYQKKIVSTLSNYDQLIENNKKQIELLERSLVLLFDEWFVRGRYQGGIEEHQLMWTEKKVGDLCKVVSRGVTPDYAEEGIFVINQKCIRDGLVDMKLARLSNATKKISKNKYVQKGDILINSTGTGTLGRTAIYRHNIENVTLDTHVTIVRAKKKEYSAYLGYYFRRIEALLENLGRGTTNQLELSVNDIKRIKIKVPKDETYIKMFNEKAYMIFEQMELLEKQNDLLLEQKNFLLPRLLSGKIVI